MHDMRGWHTYIWYIYTHHGCSGQKKSTPKCKRGQNAQSTQAFTYFHSRVGCANPLLISNTFNVYLIRLIFYFNSEFHFFLLKMCCRLIVILCCATLCIFFSPGTENTKKKRRKTHCPRMDAAWVILVFVTCECNL